MNAELKNWLATNAMGTYFQIGELSRLNSLDYFVSDTSRPTTVTFAAKQKPSERTSLAAYLDGKTFTLPDWKLKEKEKEQKNESNRPAKEPTVGPSEPAPISG